MTRWIKVREVRERPKKPLGMAQLVDNNYYKNLVKEKAKVDPSIARLWKVHKRNKRKDKNDNTYQSGSFDQT